MTPTIPYHLLDPLQARDWSELAAIGFALLSFAVSRRAERIFERVQDLNRDRLNLLEKSLDATPVRSRLEGLGLQLDTAIQAGEAGRKLALLTLVLFWGVCVEAMVSCGFGPGEAARAWVDMVWVAGLAATGGWMWKSVRRAARAAQEATAHGRRYEFMFISAMRKRTRDLGT